MCCSACSPRSGCPVGRKPHSEGACEHTEALDRTAWQIQAAQLTLSGAAEPAKPARLAKHSQCQQARTRTQHKSSAWHCQQPKALNAPIMQYMKAMKGIALCSSAAPYTIQMSL